MCGGEMDFVSSLCVAAIRWLLGFLLCLATVWLMASFKSFSGSITMYSKLPNDLRGGAKICINRGGITSPLLISFIWDWKNWNGEFQSFLLRHQNRQVLLRRGGPAPEVLGYKKRETWGDLMWVDMLFVDVNVSFFFYGLWLNKKFLWILCVLLESIFFLILCVSGELLHDCSFYI